jgi:Rrf2 family protein
MLLAFLAEQPRGVVHTARGTAERMGLPAPMVSKILRNLARGGILASHRGASGGYSFDRAPEQTSLAEVIRAIEGPISLVQCGSHPGACDRETHCPTRVSWSRINQEIERALERVAVSEMLATRSTLLSVGGPPPAAGGHSPCQENA